MKQPTNRTTSTPQDLASIIMTEIYERILRDDPPELPFSDWVHPEKQNRKLRRARAAQRKANKKRK